MMKAFILFTLLLTLVTGAQDITGEWNGMLSAAGMELRLVFHIEKKDTAYQTEPDSPDQNAFGLPALILLTDVRAAIAYLKTRNDIDVKKIHPSDAHN